VPEVARVAGAVAADVGVELDRDAIAFLVVGRRC
jgi:hypothetical protein